MEPKATIKQIQNAKFVFNFILLTILNDMEYMQKHPTWDLFWKALMLDESTLSSSCIDISCLKNVQK